MNALERVRFWQVAVLLVVIKLGLHVGAYGQYALHRDELLYFNQGEYPGFGNPTVPPFIGWVAFLVKSLFGHSVFGVRLLPALLGGLTIVLLAKIVETLNGKRMALVLAGAAFLLSPGFLIFDTLFTVNVFDQFFWVLLSLLFIRMVKQEDARQWIWIGVVGGVAFLNKYLVLFLIAGLVFGLVFTKQRTLLWSKYLVLGALTGLLIISPNLYWQYAHGWPILFHLGELEKTQMVHMTYRHFFADLFDLNSISTVFWVAGAGAVLLDKQEKPLRYLPVAAVAILALFLLLKGKAYYFLGFTPVLFALSGYVFEKRFSPARRMVNYAALAAIVLFSLLSLPLSLPVLSFDRLSAYAAKTEGWVPYPFSRWEDGKKHAISQVFSDMTGWEELVGLVHKAYLQIPEAERKTCTIYAERNYGYAGAVHFYGKKYGLPDAITFLDAYTLWAPDTIPNAPLIYIHYDIAGLDQLFDACSTVGEVENPFFREKGVKVFLCQKPKALLQEVYKQKAAEEKRIYARKGGKG